MSGEPTAAQLDTMRTNILAAWLRSDMDKMLTERERRWWEFGRWCVQNGIYSDEVEA